MRRLWYHFLHTILPVGALGLHVVIFVTYARRWDKVAALTVYDMCKAAARDMAVGALQLDYKSGGASGTYLRAGLQRGDLSVK